MAQERAFRNLSKNAKIPGFRPGKIPRKVFEQNYGTDAIENRAMEELVPQAYTRALREHDLDPIDRPAMELLPEEAGKPARVKASVEVRPEIKLEPYKGLALERPSAAVSDEDVERSLQSLARERATLVPVDRAAQLGDVLTMDYEGRVDGVAFEGGAAKGQQTELNEGRFIPGFVTGIVGMKAGETKDVEATFPEQYAKAELAGKNAVFTVTVHEVKEFELPAIDDLFAKDVSDKNNLEELRADVRARLETIAQSRARRVLSNQVMEKLLASHDVPLPKSLVSREIESMMNDTAENATRAGIELPEYLKAIGKTEDEIRAEYRTEAERRVKGTFLIEAIAKAENIAATPADVQAELQALADQYGQPVDRIRAALGGNLLSLMDGIVRTKTVNFLVDNATITESATNPS